MKIALLNPPYKGKRYSRDSRSPAVTRSGTIYYPIWLSYAAGALDETGDFDIKIIDSPASNLSFENTIKNIKDFSPNLILVNTSTPSVDEDLTLTKKLKSELKHSFIALSGTHATIYSDELLKDNTEIDMVLRGEYDYTLRELAYAIKKENDFSNIDGLSYRKDGNTIVHNKKRPLIDNLDNIPFVSLIYQKYLDINNYFFAAARYPVIMIMTGRGCPYQCSWCLYPQVMHGRRYRFRSVENVMEELKFIKSRLPMVKEIGFEDDTFTADKNRCIKICERIISEELNINWYADARADLDFETMELMKKAGCRLLIAGFESGNQKILNNIKKGITLSQSIEFMRNARKLNMLVHGCFVLGNPGETEETMQETIDFAIKLNPDTAQFFPMIIYPGTESYGIAEKNNQIKVNKFDDWLKDGLHRSVVDSDNLKSDAVDAYCRLARRKFYLRKNYIFYKIFQSVKNPEELKRNFKAFKTFSRHILR